jgi:hypothetical protein
VTKKESARAEVLLERARRATLTPVQRRAEDRRRKKKRERLRKTEEVRESKEHIPEMVHALRKGKKRAKLAEYILEIDLKEKEKVDERRVSKRRRGVVKSGVEKRVEVKAEEGKVEEKVEERPRVVLRGGGLGPTETRARKTAVAKKLAVTTSPKVWGESPAEVKRTWGKSRSQIRTWGETEAPKRTVVRKRKKEVKVEVKPAKARLTPWERTYPITRKIPTVHRRRAAEQPRDVRGRFARKVVSEYDLAPRDFFLRQQEKLDRGEITPVSYARYVHRYHERHPEYKFRGKRYRLTIQVEGIKIETNEELNWRVTVESTGIQLTPRMQKDVMERVKDVVGAYIKVRKVYLWAVYDKLTGKRIKGGGAF